MGVCRYCGSKSVTISNVIGYCVHCLRHYFDAVWPEVEKVHKESRVSFNLPPVPPKDPNGILCDLCANRCRIPEGGRGYCGVRYGVQGHLKGGRPHEGNLSYYYDPLPTNCVGNWVCPAGTGCGYPRYAARDGPEYGYKNLAVFYQACSFNCLYCQNYIFKRFTYSRKRTSAKALAEAVDAETTCVCYFGGDPTPQVLHAIKTSHIALEKNRGRILRICWETNGSVSDRYLNMMADVSLRSGGCIKFDVKAANETVHKALCGVSNKTTLENFTRLGSLIKERPVPPFLIASTLLVPGYIDEEEVASIAQFIAHLSTDIPYSLLAFYPHFYLQDLPTTSRAHALRCQTIALKAGLKNVQIGNVGLLGNAY